MATNEEILAQAIRKRNQTLLETLSKDRARKELVDKVDKTIPSYVRSYIKGQVKPTLTPEQISSLVISTIEKNQPKTVEKVIERRIEVLPPKEKKDTKELDKLKDLIDKLTLQVDELKKSPKPQPDIRVIGNMLPNYSGEQGTVLTARGGRIGWEAIFHGGSGVIGVPNPQGHAGQYVTTDGNQILWGTVAGGGANPTYIGDPNTNGSWRLYDDGTNLSVQRLEGGIWNEKGSFLS